MDAATPRYLEVKVRPNAGQGELRQDEHGTWRALLRSPPVDGKANAELIELAARHFGCRKSAVSLESGANARTKRIRIEAA